MSVFRKLCDRFALSTLACAVLGAFVAPAVAEDIDIFNNPPKGGIPPNVLLMIDNGANWESAYTIPGAPDKKTAVSDAIYAVSSSSALLDRVRLGMMIFTQNNPSGGKVVAAVDDFNDGYQGLFRCLVYNKSSDPNAVDPCVRKNGLALEKSSNSPLALSFHEAYQYFRGEAFRSGQADGVAATVGVKAGSGSNLFLGADPAAFASSGTAYKTPVTANMCANNFIILIGTINGSLQAGADTGAKELLWGHLGKEPSVIPLTPSNNESSWADEFAGFLSTADVDPAMDGVQSVTTYVIDVFDPARNTTNPSKAARALYKSIAAQGRGRYFEAKDADEIAKALVEILEEVQAVNSSFASASMPISMNVESEGTNENEVYIGMFRPSVEPRWMGNLKKYSYAWDANLRKPYMVDAAGQAAYDPVTGFINQQTTSYWTTGSSYWAGIAGYDSASDSPDGPVVEKGATGQLLRQRSTAREILTRCESGTGCSNGFRVIAASDFGGDENLLTWFKGTDIRNETGRYAAEPTVRRPSIHGDVLHSRPAVVNYGGNTGVIAFYGANDGLFRAVRGSDGKELWAVTFPEQLTKVEALYDNLAKVTVQEEPLLQESIRHPYFADGSPAVYTTISGESGGDRTVSEAMLYIPMRRGGDYIYALDISNPSANPKFKWMIKGGSGTFEELGQTWSTPKPARVEGYADRRVLFFGAGYDAAAEDYVPGTAGGRPERTRGRGIYMVDADNGARLWFGTHSDMDFSIPGDLTLVNYDRDVENHVDRAYFADTGGNIWRANFGVDDNGAFAGSITKIAALGGSCSASSDADCRKFLYHPSVVVEKDGSVSILIGSGDREHPHSDTVQNRFYMIRDTGIIDPDANGVSNEQLQALTASTTTLDADKIQNGWYFDLREGEKLTGNALSQDGNTYFNTNTPPVQSPNSCVSTLGTARQYMFRYQDPFAVVTYLKDVGGEIMPGGGFPPPPVPMTLKFDDEYWTGVGGMNPTDMGVTQPGARQKTFWAKDIDDE